jgi:hypothetical protein
MTPGVLVAVKRIEELVGLISAMEQSLCSLPRADWLGFRHTAAGLRFLGRTMNRDEHHILGQSNKQGRAPAVL